MTVLIVRAPDTQKAMDEVMRRLGADAYILSTHQSGGMIEMRAARDLPAVTTRTAAPAGKGKGQAPAAVAAPADPRPTYAIDPDDLAERLLTGSDILRNFPARILLVGPPGAGKSMLAARLAAHILREDASIRPRLIVPLAAPRLTEDRLRGWARLMGLTPEYLTVEEATALPRPIRSQPEIIDLSEVPDQAPDLCATLLDGDAEVLLAMPAGIHPARLSRECGLWQPFGARLCLTRLDQWSPEADEMVALSGQDGLPLALLADGPGLLDCLRRPVAADLSHWADLWNEEPAPRRAPHPNLPLREPVAANDAPAPVTAIGAIRGRIGPLRASLSRKLAAVSHDTAPAVLRREPPVTMPKLAPITESGTAPAMDMANLAAAPQRTAFKLFNRAPLGGTA